MTLNKTSEHSKDDNADDNDDDPHIGLEQDSEATERFVKEANKFCLTALGDPTLSPLYKRILNHLQLDERIPLVSKMGTSADGGEEELYNFWKDAKVKPNINNNNNDPGSPWDRFDRWIDRPAIQYFWFPVVSHL